MTAKTEQQPNQTPKVEPTYFYDATAEQRYHISLPIDGKKVEGFINIKPISDKIWTDYFKGMTRTNDAEANYLQGLEREAQFWKDILVSGEFELKNWDEYLEIEDITALNSKIVQVKIKSITKTAEGHTKIETLAWFNGKPATQLHILRKKELSDSAKYHVIESKSYEVGDDDGLEGRTLEIIPQDEAKAKLYRDLLIEQKGFVNDIVPLRFSSAIVDKLFASKVNTKKQV